MKKLLLAFVIITIACNNQSDSNDYYYSSLDELFNVFIFQEGKVNDNLLTQLTDSLSNNPRSYTWGVEIVDSVTDELDYQFFFTNDYSAFKITRNNVFEIYIDRSNNIFLEENRITSLDTEYENFKEFLINPNDKEDLSSRTIDYLPNGEVIYPSKGIVAMSPLLIPNSNGNHSSWYVLRDNTKIILDFYARIRDEFSQKKWNLFFSELNLEQRDLIIQQIPIYFVIFPNNTDLENWMNKKL